ncbi:MAG TPA: DUF4019 domain-containing protein [Bryobacterales bacterium]|nr:DUF4019 domain-containing protein [Bryobacterales bacterium]
MRKRCAAAAVLALWGALAAAPLSKKEQARSSAEAWVRLVDAGRYADSWTQSSSLFRSRVPQQKWEAMAKKVRDRMGPLRSRKLRRVILATSLPKAPPGEYAVVEFDSSFEKQPAAIERITMMLEDGEWRAAGYYFV